MAGLEGWYTAKELAEMRLPDLPTSDRRIRDKAQREGWQDRPRSGQGGGQEYHVSSLPQKAREAILDAEIESLPETTCQLPAVRGETLPAVVNKVQTPKTEVLKDWQRQTMDARLAILNMVDQVALLEGSRDRAIKMVVARAAEGSLPEHVQSLVPIANARGGKDGKRSLSVPTLYRWLRERKQSCGNPVLLAPGMVKDVKHCADGSLAITVTLPDRGTPAWAKPLMKCWRKPQAPFLTDVLEDLKKLLPADQMPSYDQARRYLQSIGELERRKGRVTGSELDAYKPFRRRTTDHMLPGDAYTADGHTFDAEVAHPFHGRPFRPEVTVIIDVATRMIVGWSCDLAESGLAVLDALRVACETFGPCAIFYTDNGPGYKNQMISAPGTGVCSRLGIEQRHSRPRNAKAHGIGERTHRTVLVAAAKDLVTYIGHDMDRESKQLVYKTTRKAIKDPSQPTPLIEWDEFVDHVNAAIETYNQRSHGSLPAVRDPETRKRVRLSPMQAWAIGLKRMEQELPPAERLYPANELPDLYHPMIERTVNRGEINMGKTRDGRQKRYFSAALKNHHGETVHVSYSPSDPNQVWVRNILDGSLLAIAKLDGNASPYFAQSHIEEARHKRADSRLKRLQRQVEEIEMERQGPPQLQVVQAPEVIEAKRQLAIEMTAAKVVEIPQDDRGRYRLWQQLDRRLAEGEVLSDREQKFYDGFRQTGTWKAFRSVESDLT